MPSHPSRRTVLTVGAAVTAGHVAGCVDGTAADRWAIDETIPADHATQYQGPECDCCVAYAEYLEAHLSGELDVTVTEDLSAVKAEYGIPADMQSCHTVDFGAYVVEGQFGPLLRRRSGPLPNRRRCGLGVTRFDLGEPGRIRGASVTHVGGFDLPAYVRSRCLFRRANSPGRLRTSPTHHRPYQYTDEDGDHDDGE